MNVPHGMVDDLPLPLLSVDDGKIVWANISAQEWLDVSLKGLRGQALSDSVSYTHLTLPTILLV